MKPHRPIDLDSFDEDFFSSGEENKDASERFEKTNKNTSDTNSEELAFSSSIAPELIEALMNIKPSDENHVFQDLPDDMHTEFSQTDPSGAYVTEDEILKSFPEFDFDPTVFDLPQEENTAPDSFENYDAKEELKAHKKQAKIEINEEKARIKAQKKLEQTVQKPFRVRRMLSFLLVVFLVIGVFATAFSAVIYKAGASPETAFKIGDYSICYLDGVNIKSEDLSDVLLLVKKENVVGNKTILFYYKDEYRAENIIAIGSDICAVALSQKVVPIPNNDIIGVVILKLGNIKPIYEIIHSRTLTAFIGIAVYFVMTIGIFSLLIHRQNKKIKGYREDYQLVN